MVKWLAILTLLALAVGPAKKEQHPELAPGDSGSQSAPAVSFVNNETTAPNQQCASTETPPWWKQPEWWLCILGVPTLGALFWQAQQTKLAAIATKDAAQSALRQTEHAVASDRAWLIISSLNEGDIMWPNVKPEYWWRVKNVGNTPARIIETQAVCRVSEEWGLPELPIFPRPVCLQERVLAPGDTLDFNTFWSEPSGRMFRGNSGDTAPLILIAFGYVTYRTVLDLEIHESRFCDGYIHPTNPLRTHPPESINFRPHLEAPSAYTRHT